MANTSGEKELKRNYPVETGLTARTTKQEGRVSNLVPEGLNGLTSGIKEKDKAGIW